MTMTPAEHGRVARTFDDLESRVRKLEGDVSDFWCVYFVIVLMVGATLLIPSCRERARLVAKDAVTEIMK